MGMHLCARTAFVGARYFELVMWMVNRGALPLALVRAPSNGGAPHPYVYSNPRPNATISRFDMIVACAPAWFDLQAAVERGRQRAAKKKTPK
jgi:hypothetical protein